jgi:hypothetical protein
MPKGKRDNLERLLRSAWERQARQRFTNMQNANRPVRIDPNTVWPLVGVIVAVILFLVHDVVGVIAAATLLFGSVCWLGIHITTVRLHSAYRKTAIAFVVLIALLLSIGVGYVDWPVKPYCYGFFARLPTQEDRWFFLVADPTGIAALNVDVSVWDITNAKGGPVDFSKIKGELVPVIYPAGATKPCGASVTHISVGAKEIGSNYQIMLSLGNGETVIEKLSVSPNGNQCLSVSREIDGHSFVSNMSPQFDRYGACVKPVSCTP